MKYYAYIPMKIGIIASRTQRGVLWSHNDHGDDARIFALSETGEDLGNLRYSVL